MKVSTLGASLVLVTICAAAQTISTGAKDASIGEPPRADPTALPKGAPPIAFPRIQLIAPGFSPTVSDDGTAVAFGSREPLVPEDANGFIDVFVFDRAGRVFERVSVSSAGDEADANSVFGVINFQSRISPSGRLVHFISEASNLVAGDTNGVADVFVFDRDTDTMVRGSTLTGGSQWGASSSCNVLDEPAQVLFYTPNVSGGTGPVYEKDLGSGVATDRLIMGCALGIFEDGATLGLVLSTSDSLVVEDTNNTFDVYLQGDGFIELVSRTPGGNAGNGFSFSADVSADGQIVAFSSSSSDLVPGDTNGVDDLFVLDRTGGNLERVMTHDGAEPDGGVFRLQLSEDGRYVVFSSSATNVVAGDTNGVSDIFLHDRLTGAFERLSVDEKGQQADGHSPSLLSTFGEIGMSNDARFVAFESEALNLVRGLRDDPGIDVHVLVAQPLTTQPPQALPPPLDLPTGARFGQSVAADGALIATGAPGDGDGRVHIFRLEGNVPVVDERLAIPGGFSAANFGASIAVAGNLLVVGAPSNGIAKGPNPLQAAIFERLQQRWVLKGAIPNSSGGGSFGSAVAIDGGTVMIGAPDAGAGEGAVFVYDASGSEISLRQRIDPPADTTTMGFGAAIDASKGFFAVGAPGDPGGSVPGLAALYQDVTDNLQMIDSLSGDDAAGGYGRSVSLSGNALVVGAPDEGGGAAYVYDYTPDNLSLNQRLEPDADGGASPLFGASVAVNDDFLLIGAPADAGLADSSGAVYRYARGGTGFVKQFRLAARSGLDEYGAAVAVSGDDILVGAPSSDQTRGSAVLLRNLDRVFQNAFE